MAWTRQQIEDALPAIRKMKAIDEARISANGNLIVVTKGWMLTHARRLLPLARTEICLYKGDQKPEFRYANPFSWFTHPHPVINYYDTGWNRAHMCGYIEDYVLARDKGPLEATRHALYMWQTIRRERGNDVPLWLQSVATVYVLAMVSLFIL